MGIADVVWYFRRSHISKLKPKDLRTHTRMNISWIYCILSLYLFQTATCITLFELRLIRFHNPSGREADGDCCDFPCSDQCDPDFVFCFDKPDSGECRLAKRYTGHYHANTFNFKDKFPNGAQNPLSLKLAEPWPGALYITIMVEDRDSINANDNMGKIRKIFNRVPAPSERKAKWNNMDFVFKYQTIDAQARVYCDKHYYGDDCSVFCEPKDDDVDGHYYCTDAGIKICRDNWHGEACKTYCKPADDDTGHYDCGAKGEVMCHKGWEGEKCTVDINECSNASNPCLHDSECINYNGSYSCNCSESYTGLHCQEKKLFCDTRPCSNYSTCNDTLYGFQCVCEPEWTGRFCDQVVTPCTSSPCQHGGACSVSGDSYTCTCVGMWEGWNCDQDIVIMLNDTKVLFLKGHLQDNQWDDLTAGIRHLLKDLLKIEDVAIETTITYPAEEQTRVEIFVESPDPGVVGSLDKILILPEHELKTSFILPFSEKQMVIRKVRQKPDPWVQRHWYVVVVVVFVLIAIMTTIVVVMYVIKRRRRKLLVKAGNFDSTRSHSGRESIPDAAIGFDNSLYFEAKDSERLRGLPDIPNENGKLKENGRKS
ncbi:protein jagged-1-like isoform X2 [Mya arenaria]|uniref:protein jagged-1-like isoform X2 n=1 Tax=Mya arenaria TaxID=6604 RepID=UPI0022E7D53D|nr:protein jagged-1-like isoform X2 [Mya arenaria]